MSIIQTKWDLYKLSFIGIVAALACLRFWGLVCFFLKLYSLLIGAQIICDPSVTVLMAHRL